MVLETKKITFHIENSAYTVDLGPDLDNAIRDGLTDFLDTSGEISISQLLSAYLRKNSELINFKKGVEGQVQDLINFKHTNINS